MFDIHCVDETFQGPGKAPEFWFVISEFPPPWRNQNQVIVTILNYVMIETWLVNIQSSRNRNIGVYEESKLDWVRNQINVPQFQLFTWW